MPDRLVGLCGYAQVGKDTAWRNMPGWQRAAFADELKEDIQPLATILGLPHWKEMTPAQKEIIRPMWVEWGRVTRRLHPDVWVDRLWPLLPETGDAVITDVRFPNEVKAVQDAGGIVIWVSRPNCGPANEEEKEYTTNAYKVIFSQRFHVCNDYTPAILGEKVLSMIEWAEQNGLLKPKVVACND